MPSVQVTAAASAEQPGEPSESSAAAPRLCGYSRCRRPLPDDGAGRKRDYCRDRTWPAADREVGCREAGRAERLLSALHGGSATGELDTVELGERIDGAVTALRAAVAPAVLLQDTLSGLREQLDDAVQAALTERDAASARAADAEGTAAAARQRSTEAEAGAAAAVTACQAAQRDAEQAEQARQHAEHERLGAAGRLAEVQRQLELAGVRRDALTRRTEELAGRLAHAEAERDAVRAELTAERQRTAAADARVVAAIGSATEDRERHRAESDALRREHAAGLDELRRGHHTELAELRDRHDTALAALHERLGGLTQRATAADTAGARHAAELDGLRARLAALLADTGPATDPADLRERLRAALDGRPEPTTGPAAR